jgi:phosphoribosyl 1,2-cyclic phosphodiesterase
VIRFCLLGSGSSGNALLIASRSTKLLIDSGLSYKQVALRAAAVGESLDDLQAVFITHEHRDHVNGVGTLARRLKVPVFITPRTLENLPPTVGTLPEVRLFEAGETLSVGNIRVTSFSVTHDAVDPVSYVIEADGVKVGVASDLGHAPALVQMRLAGAHALVLESNYCPRMLRDGPYPPMLQQRIRSKHGHLSNADMNSLLSSLLHEALRLVVLVHISEKNNCPDLAHQLARQVMGDHPAELHVALQDRPTPLFTVCL